MMMDPMQLMTTQQPSGMESLLPLLQSGGGEMLRGEKPVQPEEVSVPLGSDYKQELINSILQAFAQANPVMDLMRMLQPMMQQPQMQPQAMGMMMPRGVL